MISSAQRTLRILEAVGRSECPIGVTELARQLGYSVGTVFRGLDALESVGYLARFQASSRYVMGPAVGRLRHALLAKFKLKSAGLPYMRQLAFATGESVSLTMPVGWYGLRLAAAPGANEVTSSPPLGHLKTLHHTVAGRAILAAFGPEQVKSYLAWAASQPDKPRPGAALREDLKEISRRGFATEATAFAKDRATISFALRGAEGPLGALTIEGPVFELGTGDNQPALDAWIAVVASLQAIVDSEPDQFINPFAHMAPGDIHLTSYD